MEISREMFTATRQFLITGKWSAADALDPRESYLEDIKAHSTGLNPARFGKILRGLKKNCGMFGESVGYAGTHVTACITFWHE